MAVSSNSYWRETATVICETRKKELWRLWVLWWVISIHMKTVQLYIGGYTPKWEVSDEMSHNQSGSNQHHPATLQDVKITSEMNLLYSVSDKLLLKTPKVTLTSSLKFPEVSGWQVAQQHCWRNFPKAPTYCKSSWAGREPEDDATPEKPLTSLLRTASAGLQSRAVILCAIGPACCMGVRRRACNESCPAGGGSTSRYYITFSALISVLL